LRGKTGRLVRKTQEVLREIADGVGVKKVEIQIRKGKKGKACHSSSVVPLIIKFCLHFRTYKREIPEKYCIIL
jgi:hypothetical protein